MAIRIRHMNPGDVAWGMSLKDQAGWNQTRQDWERFLALEPEGCFVAEYQGQRAGTTVALCFGQVAWLAMVLVDHALRRRGIGRALVAHALQYLESRQVLTVRLDATSLGRPLYEQFGFQIEYSLTRFTGVPVFVECSSHISMRPADAKDFSEVCTLDATVTHTDRRRLLAAWWSDKQVIKYVTDGNNQVSAYAMIRPGSRASMVGPILANPDIGLAVFSKVLVACAARPIYLDLPDFQPVAQHCAERVGLRAERSFFRMWLGQKPCELRHYLWASSGPECG
ncbi:MAG: GNAT family N-acetyltransferase [Gemmatales bacterium]|nr:GNAT family N-acetyltransferase [Gemmatales bacterium]MDW8176692.1 GNAT family N-acetyltransferase [Gemmatales bacterium]